MCDKYDIITRRARISNRPSQGDCPLTLSATTRSYYRIQCTDLPQRFCKLILLFLIRDVQCHIVAFIEWRVTGMPEIHPRYKVLELSGRAVPFVQYGNKYGCEHRKGDVYLEPTFMFDAFNFCVQVGTIISHRCC